MNNAYGQELRDLLATATQAAVVVAPFLKEKALCRIIKELPEAVALTIVTRWRPEEVARGVSDLSVFDLAASRPDTHLLLHPTLHAKYFRADEQCLVGSANVTATALGYRQPSNLELLVEPAGGALALQSWEARLLNECIPASKTLRDELQRFVELIGPAPIVPTWMRDPFLLWPSERPTSIADQPVGTWVPHTRHIELLWRHYEGDWDSLASFQQTALRHDFHYLQVPPGLKQDAFDAYVADVLERSTVVVHLDAFLATGSQRFGAVRAWMSSFLAQERIKRDAVVATQDLYRWVLYFLPHRFVQVESRYSEVLAKR